MRSAVTLLCALGIFGCDAPASRPRTEDTHPPAARKTFAPAQPAGIVTVPPRPQPPSVPRTITTDVKVEQYVAQVYLDNARMIAHRKACRQWHKKMVRTPRAAALMGGYELHSTCANLSDPPEYRKHTVLSPEWVAYERELAEYERRTAPQQAETLATPELSATDVRVDPTIYSSESSASSRSSGEVHVKGYHRKDGTYVPPHTRSKPKK